MICPPMIIADGPASTDRNGPFSANKWSLLFRNLREIGASDADPIYHYASGRRFAYGPGQSSFPLTPGEASRLKAEIAQVQPSVILALGGTVFESLCRERGIFKWRGSVLESDLIRGIPIIPTFSVDYLLKSKEDTWIFQRDLQRFHGLSLRQGDWKPPAFKLTVTPTFEQVAEILEALAERASIGVLELGIDIETKSRHIDCIGLAWSATEALCIPLMSRSRESTHYWTLDEETQIVAWLRNLFVMPNVRVYGQNFSYDNQYLDFHWKLVPPLAWDTMLAQHCILNTSPKDLGFLSSIWCEHHVYWKDENQEADWKVPESQRWEYNCKDACRTLEIAEAQQRYIYNLRGSWPQLSEVVNFQLALHHPVQRMMKRGVREDKPYQLQLSSDLERLKADRESWINKACGHHLNIRSPKQMQQFFYDDLQLPKEVNIKTHQPTLNDEALSILQRKNPILTPLFKRIAEVRSLGVFKSTFVDSRRSPDGRIRCSFNVGGTSTYRFSSSKDGFSDGLNLQNIPSGDKADEVFALPNVRKLFLSDPGSKIGDLDLSSADLRIVTWEADVTEMKQLLREGLSPYLVLAEEYYHKRGLTKHDKEYKTFKSFAHGTHYMGTPSGIAHNLGLLVHEVDKTQKWYFDRFPGIKRYQERIRRDITEQGFVQNVWGYRGHWLGNITEKSFKEAAAWIPQSSIAILINHILMEVDIHLQGLVELLIQVHDSLVFQYPLNRTDLEVRIEELSQIVLPYDDPLIIPIGMKTSTRSWGDCK